jgi:putative glutamine amidotransferase
LKPVIGITCSNDSSYGRNTNLINYTYVNAVFKSGGTPVIIPIIKDERDAEAYLDILDGIIFSGGGDVSPLYFNEEPVKEVECIDFDRDASEITLFNKAYEKGIPIFGICRGAQLLNIALSGDIYQDIYTQVQNVHGHTCGQNVQEGYHTINIIEDSIMYEIFKKDKLVVNSQHHQAIRKLGKNLRVTARSKDGIIEAIEATDDKFILGVQFHPEAMAMKYDEFLNPFKYFIERCK